MRVFICIEFPDEVIKEVARVQEILGKMKFTGKMTELENLHLTLKFLGEVDDKNEEKIKRLLGKINFSGFNVRLGNAGIFSYNKSPRIVWIKIEGKGIFELQKKIDNVLKDLFRPEERFMSHMTIARIKYIKDKKGFEEYVSNIGVRDINFKVNNFKIKASELDKIGPKYRTLEEFSSQ